MNTNSCTQTRLDKALQALVVEQAGLMYPDAGAGTPERPLPMLIALPCGIHPYNRNSAYFDPLANCIVLYQDLGCQALGGSSMEQIRDTVRHELVHWWQRWVMGEVHRVSTTNVHRLRSWSEGCYQASLCLWPQVPLDFGMFCPRRRRPGPRLTDVELHHWPRSMPRLIAQIEEEASTQVRVQHHAEQIAGAPA